MINPHTNVQSTYMQKCATIHPISETLRPNNKKNVKNAKTNKVKHIATQVPLVRLVKRTRIQCVLSVLKPVKITSIQKPCDTQRTNLLKKLKDKITINKNDEYSTFENIKLYKIKIIQKKNNYAR